MKSDAAQKALEAEPWDPSVKSLVNFPDVLAMLSDRLDWTQKLGDAFIGQQQQVMDTIQSLRGKPPADAGTDSGAAGACSAPVASACSGSAKCKEYYACLNTCKP